MIILTYGTHTDSLRTLSSSWVGHLVNPPSGVWLELRYGWDFTAQSLKLGERAMLYLRNTHTSTNLNWVHVWHTHQEKLEETAVHSRVHWFSERNWSCRTSCAEIHSWLIHQTKSILEQAGDFTATPNRIQNNDWQTSKHTEAFVIILTCFLERSQLIFLVIATLQKTYSCNISWKQD